MLLYFDCVLQDVYLIAGPITDREYDPEKEKRLIRAAKKKILEDLESESFLGTGTILENNSKVYYLKVLKNYLNKSISLLVFEMF